MPLFLFHLLEFMDVDWEIDVKKVQKRWEVYDDWSQLVLKQTEDRVELITSAPSSGLWRMRPDGTVEFTRQVTTWHTVGNEDEASTCVSTVRATTATRAPTWVSSSREDGCRPTTVS